MFAIIRLTLSLSRTPCLLSSQKYFPFPSFPHLTPSRRRVDFGALWEFLGDVCCFCAFEDVNMGFQRAASQTYLYNIPPQKTMSKTFFGRCRCHACTASERFDTTYDFDGTMVEHVCCPTKMQSQHKAMLLCAVTRELLASYSMVAFSRQGQGHRAVILPLMICIR